MERTTLLCGYLFITMFCNGLAVSIDRNTSKAESVTQPPQPLLSVMSPTITPDIHVTTEPMTISNDSTTEEVTDAYLQDSDEDEDNIHADNTTEVEPEADDDSYSKNNTIEVELQVDGDSYYIYNTSNKNGRSGSSGSEFRTTDSDPFQRLWIYAAHSAMAILGILLIFFIILNALLMTQKMELFWK